MSPDFGGPLAVSYATRGAVQYSWRTLLNSRQVDVKGTRIAAIGFDDWVEGIWSRSAAAMAAGFEVNAPPRRRASGHISRWDDD